MISSGYHLCVHWRQGPPNYYKTSRRNIEIRHSGDEESCTFVLSLLWWYPQDVNRRQLASNEQASLLPFGKLCVGKGDGKVMTTYRDDSLRITFACTEDNWRPTDILKYYPTKRSKIKKTLWRWKVVYFRPHLVVKLSSVCQLKTIGAQQIVTTITLRNIKEKGRTKIMVFVLSLSSRYPQISIEDNWRPTNSHNNYITEQRHSGDGKVMIFVLSSSSGYHLRVPWRQLVYVDVTTITQHQAKKF